MILNECCCVSFSFYEGSLFRIAVILLSILIICDDNGTKEEIFMGINPLERFFKRYN